MGAAFGGNNSRVRFCQRGDRIAVLLPQGVETALAHIAALKMGCISLPLFTLFGPDALLHRLKDSGAKVVITNAEGAAKIVFRREIQAAKDPVAEEKRLVADYKAKFANPYQAAARGYVDDIIEPRRTRPVLIQALELLASKRDRNPPKKHGNIPL